MKGVAFKLQRLDVIMAVDNIAHVVFVDAYPVCAKLSPDFIFDGDLNTWTIALRQKLPKQSISFAVCGPDQPRRLPVAEGKITEWPDSSGSMPKDLSQRLGFHRSDKKSIEGIPWAVDSFAFQDARVCSRQSASADQTQTGRQ